MGSAITKEISAGTRSIPGGIYKLL
ncbi:uncharacterized protein METZ01_LOCUS426140 [marine metagenome]|uniref:Uncharacterized protein n=1 Tax=marine metagenome TaxID=408172 RepID=A0A382XQF5_9ZZZZ